ncbi:hypothetical protein BCR35DRAFT_335338 [Leucosporidium creatinivorum]|uniref:Uncharacterized protein n=1 Tax=Leucosporidium creatinivorum TaxID=106004 RepID=A0A1Y2DCU2_9BASI|nr:hypothetical protein BCR35DRAFT_335338 [Leucosporidium creatinivorum]
MDPPPGALELQARFQHLHISTFLAPLPLVPTEQEFLDAFALLADPVASKAMYALVRQVALYMAQHHLLDPTTPLAPEIWLAYVEWNSLDPYTKARAVRRAKAYFAMENATVGVQAQTGRFALSAGLAAPRAPALPFSHRKAGSALGDLGGGIEGAVGGIEEDE